MRLLRSSTSPVSTDYNGEKGRPRAQAHSTFPRESRRSRLFDSIFRGSSSERAVKNRDNAAVKRQNQKEATHPPDIDRIRAIPDELLRGLRRGSSEKRRPGERSTPSWISEELKQKLASYSEKKEKEYTDLRQRCTEYERSLGFESTSTEKESEVEIRANEIFQQLKEDDITRIYQTAPEKRGYHGQKHPRFFGDHFLSNVDLIEQTQLFRLCEAMPKGAHLHIHFNANLDPGVLLGIAKGMERMFIWSNVPLTGQESYDLCRIQFSIMNDKAVKEKGEGDLFTKDYRGGTVMQFQKFLAAYPGGPEAADAWLQSKLVFHEEEAHNLLQTADGLVQLKRAPRTCPAC